MNDCPPVSIIVPVYNVEPYLCRCLDAIRHQTYTNFEVIIIDDGSSDNSGTICDSYVQKDKRFSVIHTENRGLSAARNTGIDSATGSFITFVDSDDVIAATMLEDMLSVQKITGADIVKCRAISFKDDHELSSTYIEQRSPVSFGRDAALRYLLKSCTSFHGAFIGAETAWGKLYSRKLFSDIRFPYGKIYEDNVTAMRIVLRCQCYALSENIGYYYYRNDISITRSRFTTKDFDLREAVEQVIALVQDTSLGKSDAHIKYALEVLCARSYYTLLAKIAKWGVDPALDEQSLVQTFLHALRGRFISFWRVPLPLSRRIVLVAMATSWPLGKRLLQVLSVSKQMLGSMKRVMLSLRAPEGR